MFLVRSQIETCHPEKMKQFRSWLRHKNNDSVSTLHYCAQNGLLKAIEFLIDQKISFERTNEEKGPVHFAAQGDSVRSLAFFRSRGTNLDEPDSKGLTPLHWACLSGSDQAVMFLSAWGVNLNARDCNGSTPLHLAISSGNIRSVKRLLIKGANRFLLDNQGMTPLEIANQTQNALITYMLVI
jgi:ankyrin repeat protein